MPGIAPRFMAWQRRMGTNAGPLNASGETGSDNPVTVELLVNGTWIDITSYVMVRDNNGNINITRGRKDEGSTTEQSTCQLTLNNRDGRWSPRNPSGAYYGYIGRNQPVRVYVPDGLGGKSYRFQGEISIWPQSWDPTGTDVWTDVEASGILRRLSQGPPRAHSAIYSALIDPTSPNLRAYWPCEDASDATSLSSPLVNGSAMTYSGTPTLAGYENFGGSDPVILTSSTTLTGGVANYTDPTETQVRFLCSIPSDGILNDKVICAITNGEDAGHHWWELVYTTTGNTVFLQELDGDGAFLSQLDHTLDVRGRKLYVSIELREVGATCSRTIRLLDLSDNNEYTVTDTASSATLSPVNLLEFGNASHDLSGTAGLSDVAIGHITLEDAITPFTALGRGLNPVGESAGRRIQRLCAEEGIAFEYVGDLDDCVTLGAQTKLNPISLMQEAELADTGMIYESMPTLGLGYRTRVSLCNQDAQLTLNYAGYNLSEVPTPVEDDRYVQNQVTVTVGNISETYSLTTGALSTAVPPSGVGVYGTDVTLNLESTSEARSHAAWRVHLGTVDEPRYPQISVNLAHSSFTSNPALKQAVLGLRQGDRIVVQNMPSWLPPGDVDQIILGFEETISHFEHRITFICAPASPYRVGVFDRDIARVDTDGSGLLLAVNSSATQLVVKPTTNDLTLWTTSSSEFPFDVYIGGEIMRVTNITSFLYDTFTRSVSSGWGTSDNSQAWSTAGGSATDFNVSGTVGQHTLSTTGASRRSFITAGTEYEDFDFYASMTTSATATGGSLNGGLAARYVDSSNMMTAQLEFTTANTITLTIRKRVNDVQTTLGSYTLPDAYVAGTYYRVRFQGRGSNFKAKCWAATTNETPEWQVTVADSSLPNSPFFGFRSISDVANTNVNPIVSYDDANLMNPQLFTVTRSINGIVKSQSAGADVRLAYPTTVSL